MTDPPHDDWIAFITEPDATSRPRLAMPEYIAVGLGLLVVIGLISFWPSGSATQSAADQLSGLGIPSEFHEAAVQDTTEYGCGGTTDLRCLQVVFEIQSGPDAGRTYLQELPLIDTTPTFTIGQKVVLSRVPPNGRVTSLELEGCEFDPSVECTRVGLTLSEGPGAPGPATFILFPGQDSGISIGNEVQITFESDGAIVGIAPASIQTTYQYADAQRRWFLTLLVALFAAAVIALGRWRGVAALAGLGLSLVVVIIWLIPSLLDGNPPAVVALIAASAVAFLALYVSHGFTRISTVALIGTIGALGLTTLLSVLTVALGSFTGFTSEESTLLLLLDGIDIRGLMLAGIVIGAAGALDDVTVTQASAIHQVRLADPSLSRSSLFARGMTIGRAHVGSIVNTLMLAYLGAALPLTILFVIAQQSLGTVANSEVVAVEIVRTIVGTLGIIAAVPLTTWLATIWPSSQTHAHGLDG
ncbi:MAG: YibE/F family protein [Actinomycetota bacterium]|nr:YibE/F family protein [Actinomycetota bacterium]